MPVERWKDEYIMNTFMDQLEIHISSETRHCYQTGRNTGHLCKSMISRSRLLRGIVTGAEARINTKKQVKNARAVLEELC